MPMLSELPFKFNLENYERSGLDVLFYGQEYYDTNLITDGKRQIDQQTIGDLIKNQKVLSNRQLMLKNFKSLIDNLDDCEDYISKVESGKIKGDPEIARALDKCLSQFTAEDMALLEQMVQTNFQDAMIQNNLIKLQMA